MNVFTGIGRLTADPITKKTVTGLSVCNFTIALDRPKKKDGSDGGADFINCTAWNKTAENLTQYTRKGNLIAIDGSLHSRKYTDKQGNNRIVIEVVCNGVQFLEHRKEVATPEPEKEQEPYIDPTADLPF